MPKVKNLIGKGIPLFRHRILPDGRIQDQHGHVHNQLTPEQAHTVQAQRLVKAGWIEIEGMVIKKKVVAVKPGVVAKVVLKDDLWRSEPKVEKVEKKAKKGK